MASELAGRVRRAVLWSGANTVISRILNVLLTAVVVRLVTPHEFGNFAVAITVFTVITGFSELGLSAALARQDLDPERIGPTVSLLSLVSGTALAVAMAVFASPLAAALGAPEAAGPLRVLSLSVFMVGLFAVPAGLATREFRQDAVFTATMISFVPSSILLVVMALHGDGALAFAWSRVLGQLVIGAVLFFYVRRAFWPRFQRAQFRVVAGFGVPVAGANLVRYVLLNADYLFVGRLLGPASLGIYMLAFNIGSWATSVLSSMINSVAMPAFSHESADPGRLRESYRHAVTLVSLGAFPIAGLTAALATPVILVLYGDRWAAAVPVLVVLSIYGALFALTLLLGNLLVATGASGRLFLLQCGWLAALVPAMALGVTWGGLRGAALAHIATIVLVVIPAHLVPLRKKVPGAGLLLLQGSVKPLLLAAVASVVAWLVAMPFGPALVRLLVGGSVASAVYLALALPLLRPYLPVRLAQRCVGLLAAYDASVGRVLTPLLAARAPETPDPAFVDTPVVAEAVVEPVVTAGNGEGRHVRGEPGPSHRA